MMKFFVAASVAALSLVGATAQAATSVYAGYDGSYDSTYFTIVTDQALTGVTFTGQQDGNPSVDTWNVGNVAAGSTTLYFTSIGAFQYDYDDYFGGAATYTFSADSLAPASFSP